MDIVGVIFFIVLLAAVGYGIYRYSKAKKAREYKRSYGAGGWSSGSAEQPLDAIEKDKTKK